MKEIKAPNFVPAGGTHIFLAGSIEMGVAEMWQERATKMFEDTDFTILNPRRDDWDNSWIQSADFAPFNEQVTWELDNIENADGAIVFFAKDTKAPITLLELGLLSQRENVLIGVVCPDDFYRKGNVEVVCRRYGLYLAPSLEDAVAYLKENLK
jgi:hypothetical protein